MRSPKQFVTKTETYKYYAGFSPAFVADVLDRYSSTTTRVLDPWNGSGTTTSTCAARCIESVGVEINPAMLPVAWSRLVRPDLALRLCDQISKVGTAVLGGAASLAPNDPISIFFEPYSAQRVTNLRSFLISLVTTLTDDLEEREAQALFGFAFVVLSEVIRDALQPLRGTNPAWYAKPRSQADRLIASTTTLLSLLHRTTANLRQKTAATTRSVLHRWPELFLGDSRDLSEFGDFELVISSPPYCTRIDYAIATTPELLAHGGVTQDDLAALRKTMIGAVVTSPDQPDLAWMSETPILRATLELIRGHHTKAAATYYARYFFKYFSDLAQSLDQIALAVPSGHIVLVVQNSFFKDIRIDLTAIVTELLARRHFRLTSEWSHPARPTIAGSNPRFRTYRDSNISAEDVLVFSNI